MYKVSITSRSERDLRKTDRQSKNKLVISILALSDDPRPTGCRKVLSEPGVWRIRVGDFRVGYTINDSDREIIIIRIAHRREFYD